LAAFVAFYLAHLGWSVRDVGFMLTIGSFAARLFPRNQVSTSSKLA